VSGNVAHPNPVPTPGGSATSLQPSNLLGTVLKGLYNSANTTTQNFGFTIPQAAMVLGALVLIVLAWSMIAAMRNRKSFTLEDEDGEFPESPGGLHGGLLRP
jgi:hypothetical protein